MEDAELIDRFFARDEKALEIAEKKYRNYCHSIAYSILENHEDAEECVNDTFIKAWYSIPPNHPECLKAFLGKVARNLSFDRYRKLHTKKRGNGQIEDILDEMTDFMPSGVEPATELEKKETIEIINAFLVSLSPERCTLFVRRYWYGESIAQIAKEQKLNESNVSVILSRLRKNLARELERRMEE